MRCASCGAEMQTSADDYMNCVCSYCKIKRDNPIPAMQGWICPRCGVVHSPFVTECTCPPPIRTWSGTTTDDKNKSK